MGTQNKKPVNWTKIGGVTHSIEPVDLVEPTGPVSTVEYPSLPPALASSNDDSNWSSVSKKSNSSSGKSFVSAASKQSKSVNANTSLSINANNASKDMKSNNDAKAKKGIKNQKKVRQDLMSLMTGK